MDDVTIALSRLLNVVKFEHSYFPQFRICKSNCAGIEFIARGHILHSERFSPQVVFASDSFRLGRSLMEGLHVGNFAAVVLTGAQPVF
jgi:hypothetical protein